MRMTFESVEDFQVGHWAYLMRMRRGWGAVLFKVCAILTVLLICPAIHAEEPGKGDLWRSVERVRGRVSLEHRSTHQRRDASSHLTAEYTEVTQVDFTMERLRPKEEVLSAGGSPQQTELLRAVSAAGRARDEAESTQLVWHATAAKITGRVFGTHDEGYPHFQVSYTKRADYSGPPLYLDEFSLELDTETGRWQLTSPNKVRDKFRQITSGTEINTTQNKVRVIDEVSEIDGVVAGVFSGSLAGKPGSVHGNMNQESNTDPASASGRYSTKGRIEFWAEPIDAEVEITIKGYADWRPEGSIAKPSQPGNHFVARGTLVPKAGGRVKDLPKVKSFRFELLDTSNEPGICLNWPLQAKDTDFDLRLSAAPKFESTLSKKDQVSGVGQTQADEEGRPYAETQIDSYDFGGKATFRVTCELVDGREIVGVMKSEGGEESLVMIPKMNGPDWIAESWREKHNLGKLAAEDDEEKVAGQQYHGDGFTLYEEYRGWVEKGKRLEGDPRKKDFFVRNNIGADAKGGIALFERVSQLSVHAQLRASEIIILNTIETESEANAKGERIMNLNHRHAPHRVDQHAVHLITTDGYGSRGGGSDAVRNGDQTKRAFRPGKVQTLHVEERGRSSGIFSKQASMADYNLSERDAAFAYDRGVAHELLHSVGVDHHGEGEEPRIFFFQGAGDPMNTAHRPRFVPYMSSSGDDFGKKVYGQPAVFSDFDRGPTITLKWEDTKEDVAQSLSADFERELTAERNDPLHPRDGSEQAAKYPQYGRDAAFWSELSIYNAVSDGTTKRGYMNAEAFRFDRNVVIGREHQADSGNELCLMRYYFANAYPVGSAENIYYLVRPGKNRAGRELCDSPTGTGANAHDHEPKSRFGDAAQGRGGCFGFICPNDAIPPRNL